jgi:hypothetical protein
MPEALGSGFCVATVAQLEPFHCSASGAVPSWPTASHAVALTQLTENKIEASPSGGCGTEVADHFDPFH